MCAVPGDAAAADAEAPPSLGAIGDHLCRQYARAQVRCLGKAPRVVLCCGDVARPA